MAERSTATSSNGAGTGHEHEWADSALPTPLTTLLGREDAVIEILRLLDSAETRLLTLTGPGGVGKTRLATEVAHRVEQDFADGASFVALAPIRDPDLILPAVAKALGVSGRADRPVLDMLIFALQDRHLLLVLDNFEHLLEASPGWLTRLLAACPRLKTLVTSRTVLNIEGEQRFVVPPLPVPEPGSGHEASKAAALTLFAQRAHAVNPDFIVDEANLETVMAICSKLDGLPLAIELAAARIGVLTADEILSRLTDRFRLLTGGKRDAPARLRSMRDAIAWSCDLLSPEGQRLFHRLSVFVGGFTLEAAEALADGPALDGIATLIDNSLLRLAENAGGESRYLILETIREYGLERLADSGEEKAVRNHHADWCMSLVGQNAHVLSVIGEGYLETIDQLDADYGNLRVAMTWLDTAGRHDDLAQLLISLGWYWQTTVREAEGLPWYTRLITLLNPASRHYLDTLLMAGSLACRLGSSELSPLLEEGLALARASNDRRRQAFALAHLGISTSEGGDYIGAETLLRDARGLFALVGDTEWVWWMEYQLGVAALGRGELDEAARLLRAVKAEAERRQIEYMSISCVDYLFLVAFERDDTDEVLRMSRYLDSRLARTEILHGHPVTLSMRAMLAMARERRVLAARLFGAASRSAIRALLPERAIIERAEAETRRRLGEDVWNRERERGRRVRPSELAAEIDRLMANADAPTEAAQAPASTTNDLTDREGEVLRLLADGLTNAQIADRLYISQRTAATHVRHIFDKLDVSTRAAAVAYAIRTGLA